MAYNEDEYKEELELARQMKDNYCDKSGKETNPAKAAEIIYQIGQIYRNRSPNKISQIRCIGLLNAAIIRNPLNISQIKSDLAKICQHILQQAGAKNQNVDLVKKAKQVKISINELRSKVTDFFRSSVTNTSINATKNTFRDKISAIQSINKLIANAYKHIMKDISEFCENAMGKPPCEYAIVGMGSLAREETTPYSDFEHIILLPNDENYVSYMEYFKWFSVIFHVIVLNLQETIIPSLDVYCLKGKDSKEKNTWYYDAITPRGISFDGMMPHACKFPLGRQTLTTNKPFTTELIKPVNEMLEYLSSEADLKNGYHLADILTKTCFVSGNRNIYGQFVDGTHNYRDKKSLSNIIDDVKKQVKEDLDKFSTRFQLTQLNSKNNINIKQLVYRSTTIFIAALAWIHNISANSCFDTVEKLKENKKITRNTAHKLHTAIAIACKMRLKIYMKRKSQSDNAIDLKESNGIKEFLDIVGVGSTISYFQIAYCLQRTVAKQLNFTEFHFYSNPKLINITIGIAFGMRNLVYLPINPQNQFSKTKEFDFDACIDELEASTKFSGVKYIDELDLLGMLRKVMDQSHGERLSNTPVNKEQVMFIANELFSAKMYDESVDFYKQMLNICHRERKNHDDDLAWSNYQIGVCCIQLNKHNEALNYLKRALDIKQNAVCNAEKDTFFNATVYKLDRCHIEMYTYRSLTSYLNHFSRNTCLNAVLNAEKDTNIAAIFLEIGRCHIALQNFTEALNYLHRSLEIQQNATLNTEKDISIAVTLSQIGVCHIGLCNYNEALKYLNRSLEIDQNSTLNVKKDTNIAATLHDIGRCHINLYNYNEALKYLNGSLKIQQNVENDTIFAEILNDMSPCDNDEGLKYQNRALKRLNAKKDARITAILYDIGRCHIDLCNCNEALKYLNRSLKIQQIEMLSAKKDARFTKAHSRICMFQSYDDEALKYPNQSQETGQYATFDAEKDTSCITATLQEIVNCHIDLHNYDEALKFINWISKYSANCNASFSCEEVRHQGRWCESMPWSSDHLLHAAHGTLSNQRQHGLWSLLGRHNHKKR